ncbi:ribosome biogenesis GTP-binding protein YihA/YsxC [Anaerocellum diazotrophicum]|uniref:Probable GTP-binding protein EngB n=1 Tax=Caldicellulosiruptor diazotrophicus TaxID=2806205 RepID=A0ABN6E800_9FIRM|nr:ribosome biogenesis GTP-binding protein YihA/YsxC [Caldicellulosiruptor diazotrophicus]BCS81592.1 putative GTP-binding protein EngB [Caldicellulosiruptor diazotrophicus]
MKINLSNARLEKVAVKKEDYPPIKMPEMCICGRSNVGKSSFINAVFKDKLAKVGSTPGKTRTINFFNIDNKFRVVDLPGYGYAEVSKEEKRRWKTMIEEYLLERQELKLSVLLLDSRHLPTEDDKIMLGFFDKKEIPIMIVLTKCDKLSNNELAKNTVLISKELGIEKELFYQFSAKSGMGVKQVQYAIIKFMEEAILQEKGKK